MNNKTRNRFKLKSRITHNKSKSGNGREKSDSPPLKYSSKPNNSKFNYNWSDEILKYKKDGNYSGLIKYIKCAKIGLKD